MIDLIPVPNSPLADRLNHATATFEDAQEQMHDLRMLDVARIVRDALPTAEAVVIDNTDFDRLRLHAILDGFGRELWTHPDREPQTQPPPQPPLPAVPAVPPQIDGYRTRDGSDWDDVIDHVEHMLISALGAAPPRSWWRPVGDGGTSRYRADLPSRDAVAATQTNNPWHPNAHLRHLDRGAPAFWLADPVPYPTMTVDGVHLTAYRDPEGGPFPLLLEINTENAEPPLEPGDGGPPAINICLNSAELYPPQTPEQTGSMAADKPGVDPDVLEQVLTEQVGRHATEEIFTQLDTAIALPKQDVEIACWCAEREQPLSPDVSVCDACGRGWCGRCHPTPSGRCPFEYDHPDPQDNTDTVRPSRLTWHAGAFQGEIGMSEEQTVTLLLDGHPLLGIDIANGKVLMWPDGETARTIAAFDPALSVQPRHDHA